MAENQCAGEDCAEWIGEALAGDIRCRTVDRLVEIDFTADGGGRQHAKRAGDDGGLVRENVAEEIFGEYHVVAAGLVHQVHGHGVYILMLKGDVREFFGDLSDGCPPELRDFKHVSLVDARDLVMALAG